MKCELCQLENKEHDSLWREFFSKEEVKSDIFSSSEISKHFNSHRPRQAPFRGNAKEDPVRALGARKKAVMNLALRVRAFPPSLPQKAIYWPGEGSSLRTAEANALLGLRDLFSKDLLYRLYLEHLPGPRMRSLTSPAFFLGGAARPWAQNLLNRELKNGEWLSSLHSLPSRDEVRSWQEEADIIASVFGSLPERIEPGRRFKRCLTGEVVEANLENVFDRRWADVSFVDPLGLAKRVRAGAIIALRYRSSTGEQSLVPVFIYRDRGVRDAQKVRDDIMAHAALTRSGKMRALFPSLPKGVPVPVLIVTPSARRQDRLISQRLSQALPVYTVLSSSWQMPLEQIPLLTWGEKREVGVLEMLHEQRERFPDALHLQ